MDTPFQIGLLEEGAGPAWLSLMNSGLRDCPGFEPLVDLDYQRMWGGGRARTGLTLAAEREGELVGAVSLILGTRRDRLRDLVVRPDARRCGVGTALVEAALDRFRSRGLHPSTGSGQCLAEGQDWDAPSYRAFYEALGFHPVRRYLFLRWDLTAPLPALPLNHEVVVRQATLADLEEMSDLYARMYSPYWDWSRDGTLEEVREKYHARFAQRLSERENDRVYLVAVLEGRLVAGITARIDQEYNRAKGVALGSLNPGGVGVLPAYRRRGIGSRLLAECLSLLRERGMRHATVWTFSYLESEAPAVVLYRRGGATVARRSLGWEKAL
ncbi:MAG: GNAT family N-acetyltransferase [Anaerolineae bacterium]|nr:GNAT family N-acetyltransferase [Anaerolineae bacterium]